MVPADCPSFPGGAGVVDRGVGRHLDITIMTGIQRLIGWIATLLALIIVVGMVTGWLFELGYMTVWYNNIAIMILTLALVLLNWRHIVSAEQVARDSQDQTRILSDQLELEREPTIVVEKLSVPRAIVSKHDGWSFELIIGNRSSLHARAQIKASVIVAGGSPTLLQSKRYNGEWHWYLPADYVYPPTAVPIHERIDPDAYTELKQVWDGASDLDLHLSRQRAYVLALELDVTYVRWRPGFTPTSRDRRELPKLRWIYDFDDEQWFQDRTPEDWKADALNLDHLIEPEQ